MAFLSRSLAQIRAQLQGLTMSQRLLLGLLVVMLVGTIFFVVEFSRKPEMVELLPQAAKPEEISTMVSFLKSNKYTYEVQGDKILVPVEQAYEIRGELAAAQALPENTSAAFTALAASNDFMQSDASVERRWNVGTQQVLEQTLGHFPYIARATVVIARGQPDGIGRPSVPSSASVYVGLKGGTQGLTSNQVVSVMNLVSGAVAGLKRENINLTDGTHAYRAPSEDTGMAGDTLEFTRKLETDYEHRLAGLLEHLGDVKIAVNVVPDMSTAKIQKQEFDKPLKGELENTAKDSSTTDGTPGGGAPGVVANTAQSANSGGARGSASTVTDSSTKNDVRFPQTDTLRTVPPGAQITDKTATITVPRSYYQAIFQRMKKDDKADPSDAELKDIITEHATRIREQVKSAIGITADNKVTVDWYYDVLGTRGGATATEGGAVGSKGMGQLVSQYAKQTILAVMAMGGLMMMLMMVRRAAPTVAGSEADVSVFGSLGIGTRKGKGGKGYSDPNALDVEEDVIGEAGQGEAVLTGIELDDETLQSRKMVDEVSIMIKENPENAATLVKKWMKGK